MSPADLRQRRSHLTLLASSYGKPLPCLRVVCAGMGCRGADKPDRPWSGSSDLTWPSTLAAHASCQMEIAW